MKNRWVNALISSTLSISPMIVIVLVLNIAFYFTSKDNVFPLNGFDLLLLICGMIVLIAGLTLFQIGVSSSLSKVGQYMGGSLSKQKNLFIVIIFALTLGALITCAEPSILIVSKQVSFVSDPALNAILLIGSISIGVGIFVVIGVLRIIFHKSLKIWYLIFYLITFALIIVVAIPSETRNYLPFIFDSGGVTTGSATVPFILALGAGIATVRGGKSAKDDSFGLVGMASIGPIMTMALMIIIKNLLPGGFAPYVYEMPEHMSNIEGVIFKFIDAIVPSSTGIGSMVEVLIALSPILIIFFIYNAIFIKLPKNRILSLLTGFLFSFIGLTLFLGGANAAMTTTGKTIGMALGNSGNYLVIFGVAFIIGLVTILCEPAVHVLTKQMVDISDGGIKKITVIIVLSLGVGIAILLAAIRAVFGFSILWYIVPLYGASLVMMIFTPTIYTAMAFDSGGTASGPMSSSFVLPMIIGLTYQVNINKEIPVDQINFYGDAFGVVALIAITPVIAVQLLGIIQKTKQSVKVYLYDKTVYDGNDAQIIHF